MHTPTLADERSVVPAAAAAVDATSDAAGVASDAASDAGAASDAAGAAEDAAVDADVLPHPMTMDAVSAAAITTLKTFFFISCLPNNMVD